VFEPRLMGDASVPTIDTNFCWGVVAGLAIFFWFQRLQAAGNKVASSFSSKTVAPVTAGFGGCFMLLLLLAVPAILIFGQGVWDRVVWLLGL
jgi:hypothetical protein